MSDNSRQIRILQVVFYALMLFTLVIGLLYQFMNWRLQGCDLILIAVFVINSVNLLNGQLTQALARIDELEKRMPSRRSA